ncbi:GNAT family N-acetyltransferase [Thalassococcus sp. CAU 1522]|uniref:GNAT family N-acetyltransferase n=1 Tax=Thalassococcus arenae TaxID=2851652 RepID=A0ABS6N508_9RHOB|nr:GNAT family N-acetyltransferase [Thalassococcus arenae]MBV2359097.1 GNAT family N-acetyltransferase [Thalassococcus arenae]
MSNELSLMEIGALSDKQFTALRQLRVSKRQEVLGKSFLESIEDWEIAPREQVLGLCFVIHESPVGMVLFRRQAAPEDQRISVHGLKIALPWQQKGYGHQAFRQAMQYVRDVWPDTELLSLAVDAENKPAVAVYREYGMSDSGPIFDGPNGKEHHMEVSLRT